MAKKGLLFNLSGHTLPEVSLKQLEKKYEIKDIEIPTLDLSTPEKAIKGAKSILNKIYTDYSTEVQRGDYEVILPGMSILTIISLTILHGISGHFPKIRYIYKTDDGFRVSERLDLQNLRIKARDSRFFT